MFGKKKDDKTPKKAPKVTGAGKTPKKESSITKENAEKEAKAKLAGEVYDLMILNHTPEQRKHLPSRESFIEDQFKTTRIGGRVFKPITIKELEDAKAELLQKFSQKKADKATPKATPAKPAGKRSEPKPAAVKPKYKTILKGTTGDIPQEWDTLKEAESAKRNAELLGYEVELKKLTLSAAPKETPSAKKPAEVKKPSAPKKTVGGKNGTDKLLMHNDKDEMKVTGEKPIVINAANAKPKRAPKVLRRVARSGGYTAWDVIKRSGKTFATEQEAKDYAADVLKKTGKIVPVTPTDRQVTHTFKSEQTEKK